MKEQVIVALQALCGLALAAFLHVQLFELMETAANAHDFPLLIHLRVAKDLLPLITVSVIAWWWLSQQRKIAQRIKP